MPLTPTEMKPSSKPPSTKKRVAKSTVNKRLPREQQPPREETPRIKYDIKDRKTRNYGDVHADVILVRVEQAFQDVTGVPRGLLTQKFKSRAREVLREYHPILLASSAANLLTLPKGDFNANTIAHLPLSNTVRFRNAILFLDLLETMNFVANKRKRPGVGTAPEVGVG